MAEAASIDRRPIVRRPSRLGVVSWSDLVVVRRSSHLGMAKHHHSDEHRASGGKLEHQTATNGRTGQP